MSMPASEVFGTLSAAGDRSPFSGAPGKYSSANPGKSYFGAAQTRHPEKSAFLKIILRTKAAKQPRRPEFHSIHRSDRLFIHFGVSSMADPQRLAVSRYAKSKISKAA